MKFAIPLSIAVSMVAFSPGSCDAQSAPVEQGLKQLKLRQAQMQVQMLESAVMDSRQRVKQMLAELEQNNTQLTELDVSAASYEEITRMLQTQRVQLMIELAGLDARQQKMIELRDATRQRQSDQHDEVTSLLQQMVDQLSEKQKRLNKMYEQGSMSIAEVKAGELMLLQAQLNLAQAKADSPAEPAYDMLTDISIERAEQQARLQMVESLLKKYYQARDNISSVRQLNANYEMELQRTMDLENRLQQAELQMQMQMNEPD